MKKITDISYAPLLAAVLAFSVALTLVLQIFRAEHITKTETTLFGVLQFLFSLAFAWILSRASSRKEFQESQRRFAIAAYRRVREIERMTDRLLMRASSIQENPEARAEVEVIRQVVIGIQDTVRSSISDWAEIIGDEISTVEKMEELRTKRALLLAKSEPREVKQTADSQGTIAKNLARLNDEIHELKQSLPAALQVIEGTDASDDLLERIQYQFLRQVEDYGFIQLDCFWEPNSGFDRSPDRLTTGTKLKLTIGDAGRRIGIYVAKDNKGNSVGMVMNSSPGGDYHEFAEALMRLLGESSFDGTLISIDEKDRDSGRIYFTIRVGSDADEDSVGIPDT